MYIYIVIVVKFLCDLIKLTELFHTLNQTRNTHILIDFQTLTILTRYIVWNNKNKCLKKSLVCTAIQSTTKPTRTNQPKSWGHISFVYTHMRIGSHY